MGNEELPKVSIPLRISEKGKLVGKTKDGGRTYCDMWSRMNIKICILLVDLFCCKHKTNIR